MPRAVILSLEAGYVIDSPRIPPRLYPHRIAGGHFDHRAADAGGGRQGRGGRQTQKVIPDWSLPPLDLDTAEPGGPLVTHRLSVSPPADWDLGHNGAFQLPGLIGFGAFTSTDQPVGYVDGHVESHTHSEMVHRFSHWGTGYEMKYYY